MKKVCSKCKGEKNIVEFSYKKKDRNIRHTQCKACTRALIKKHYNSNKLYYLNKAKHRNSEIRKEILEYVKKYLNNHSCIDCGENAMEVLEFDHKQNSDKVMAVSRMIRLRLSLDLIAKEISKCDVRCANCHRRKTAKYFGWYKNT